MLGYIDPMAGTIVLQAIVAGLAGGLLFFRRQVGRLLRLITFRAGTNAAPAPPDGSDSPPA
jgi:hypothetical protein